MATSPFSHCQECGQKLTSAFFCLSCRASFCSNECYQQHKARHPAAPPGPEPGRDRGSRDPEDQGNR